MNKVLSIFLDICGITNMHRDKSSISHFLESRNPAISINELNSFYPTPKIPEIQFEQIDSRDNYSVGRYQFRSEISGNGDSNAFATGEYFKKKNSSTETSVVFVHGWRMNGFSKFYNIYLDVLKEKGYHIYTIELPHHFSRESKTSLYNGELMVTTNIDSTLLSMKQAITDLRALIHYLKSKNNRVILLGLSLGGVFANLTAVLEEKIDVLISVMYANSIPFSIWNSIPGKYIKKDFVAHNFTYEKLKEYWAIMIPSNFKPVIPKEKMLLISGIYDKYVLLEDTSLLWETWDKPQRLLFRCGHSGIVIRKKKIRKATLDFLENAL